MEKCNQCIVSFSSIWEAKEHFASLVHNIKMEQLTPGKPHICELCRFECQELSEYSKHIDSATHKKKLDALRKRQLVTEGITRVDNLDGSTYTKGISSNLESKKSAVPCVGEKNTSGLLCRGCGLRNTLLPTRFNKNVGSDVYEKYDTLCFTHSVSFCDPLRQPIKEQLPCYFHTACDRGSRINNKCYYHGFKRATPVSSGSSSNSSLDFSDLCYEPKKNFLSESCFENSCIHAPPSVRIVDLCRVPASSSEEREEMYQNRTRSNGGKEEALVVKPINRGFLARISTRMKRRLTHGTNDGEKLNFKKHKRKRKKKAKEGASHELSCNSFEDGTNVVKTDGTDQSVVSKKTKIPPLQKIIESSCKLRPASCVKVDPKRKYETMALKGRALFSKNRHIMMSRNRHSKYRLVPSENKRSCIGAGPQVISNSTCEEAQTLKRETVSSKDLDIKPCVGEFMKIGDQYLSFPLSRTLAGQLSQKADEMDTNWQRPQGTSNLTDGKFFPRVREGNLQQFVTEVSSVTSHNGEDVLTSSGLHIVSSNFASGSGDDALTKTNLSGRGTVKAEDNTTEWKLLRKNLQLFPTVTLTDESQLTKKN